MRIRIGPVATVLPLFLLLLLHSGCQNLADPAATPARLNASNPQTIAELQTTAASLLARPRVTLSPGAFVTSSVVSLEPANRNTPLGRLGTGRTIELPQRLRLLRIGQRCALEHVNSGARAWLSVNSCQAESSAAHTQ